MQYSGNAHGLIKGIGVVNCLYVNPKLGRYWIINWRVYAPETDEKTKLAHMKDMLDDAIQVKKLPFRVVLMDSWYATKALMVHIHRQDKIFYCPLKSNRKVDDSDAKSPYKPVSGLEWSKQEIEHGKLIKVYEFPKTLKVKLFRVATENSRAEWIVTNDVEQKSQENTSAICAIRWKIEQYHREVKQTLGIEKCQCRSGRAQRNHIGCVILAWSHMTALARRLGSNIYRLKEEMLSNYMKQELIQPTILVMNV